MPMLHSVAGPWARVLVAVSAFLLLSMGGALVAAPLTLPLLYLVVRNRQLGAGLRATAIVIAALTVAEVGWAATYLAVSDAQPWTWLLPVAAGTATATALARNSCRSEVADGFDRPYLRSDIVTP